MPNPNLGLGAAMAAITNLENGEECLNSMQCKSRFCALDENLGKSVCMHKHSLPLNAACKTNDYCATGFCYNNVCVPMARAGEICGSDDHCETGKCASNSILGGQRCQPGTCSGCTSGAWTSASNGRQTQNYAICKYDNTCTRKTRYRCGAGYYGAEPINNITNAAYISCTACPANATCAVGDNFTFKCNSGYYRSDTACAACPSNGTSNINSGAITDCYISPSQTLSDNTGQYKYDVKCPYEL